MKQKIGQLLLNIIIKFNLCPHISNLSELYEDHCPLCQEERPWK
jgi:hypothetical protein